MSENFDQRLSRAFELIEANKLGEARDILEPILAAEMDNADAWWLYVHAVEDRTRAQDALNNVLRLNPNYPGAQELQELSTKSSSPTKPMTTTASLDDDDDFDVFDDDDFDDVEDGDDDFDMLDDDDDFDDLEDDDDEVERNPRQMIFRLLAVVVLILILLFVFVIIDPFGGGGETDPTETPTQNVVVLSTDIPTNEPTTTPTIDETEDAPTADTQNVVGDDYLDGLYTQLGTTVQVIEDSAEFRQTTLGNTLFISVCSGLGDQFRDDLTLTMTTYADLNDTITDSDIDALGVSLQNCDASNTVLNEIVTSRDSLSEYAQGNLSFEMFRSSWRTLNE